MTLKPGDRISTAPVVDRFIKAWMEDKPEYCLWGIARLDRPLSDGLIARSLTNLVKLVPVLSALPLFNFWGGYWEYREPGDLSRQVARKRVDSREEFEAALSAVSRIGIDPRREPSVKALSIDGPDCHAFVLIIHHLSVDGESVKRLLDLFAHCYREVEQDPGWEPGGAINMNRSWWQLIRKLSWWRFLHGPFYYYYLFFIFIMQSLFGKISSVIRGDRPGPFTHLTPKEPNFETLTLERETVSQVQKSPSVKGATINDTMMAAMLSAACTWNRERGEKFSRIRTVYPANLRRWWGEPEGAIGNMSCLNVICERADRLAEPRMALKTMRARLDRQKRVMGNDAYWNIASLRLLPPVCWNPIAALFRKLLLKATSKGMGMTNIGVIPESAGDFGSARALSYHILAPMFPARGVLFTVTGYKGVVTVDMNYDGDYLDRATARAFLERFRETYLAFA